MKNIQQKLLGKEPLRENRDDLATTTESITGSEPKIDVSLRLILKYTFS